MPETREVSAYMVTCGDNQDGCSIYPFWSYEEATQYIEDNPDLDRPVIEQVKIFTNIDRGVMHD